MAKYRLQIEIEVDEARLAERGGRRAGDPPRAVDAWRFGDLLGAARRRMVDPARSRILDRRREATGPGDDVVRELARRDELHPGHLWTRASFPGDRESLERALEELEGHGAITRERRADGHVGWRLTGRRSLRDELTERVASRFAARPA